MTQLEKYPDAISNHFDRLFAGLGKRGSSFTDIDGLIHDGYRDCFLFLEFKHDGEPLSKAQLWAIRALSEKPGCESWIIVKLNGGGYQVATFRGGVRQDRYHTAAELQDRYRRWWN